jgi:hypothetical protein
VTSIFTPKKIYGMKVTSFNMRIDLDRRLKQRLPKNGQRSVLINRLIEMYLNGEVQVTIPARAL